MTQSTLADVLGRIFKRNSATSTKGPATPGRTAITNRTDRDLLSISPYWDNVNGVVFNREGIAEIGIEIELPVVTTLTTKEKLNLWARLRAVLHYGVPEGQRARMIISLTRATPDAIDVGTKPGLPLAQALRNSVTQLFDNMRLQNGVLTARYVLTCTVPGPRPAEARGFTEGQTAQIMERAATLRESLLIQFETANIAARPMAAQDIKDFIEDWFNPDFQATAKAPYVSPEERTWYLQGDLEAHPDIFSNSFREQIYQSAVETSHLEHLLVGSTYVNTIVMRKVPSITYVDGVNRILKALNRTKARRAYVVMDFIHENFQKELANVRNRARRFHSTVNDEQAGYIDPETRAGLADTEDFLTYLNRSGQHIFTSAAAIVLMEDSPEDMRASIESARAALAEMGGGAPVISQLENLRRYGHEYAPFGGVTPQTRFKVLEENSADFFALTGPWKGTMPHPLDPIHPSLFLSRYNTVIKFNLFSFYSKNYCALIIAGSGSGKTYLANYLATDVLAQGGVVTITDRGGGFDPLIELNGGPIVRIGPGSEHTINPFDLPPGATFPDERKQLFIYAALRTMVPNSGNDETKEEQLIKEAIRRAFERANDYETAMDEFKRPLMENGQVVRKPVFTGVTMTSFRATLNTITEINGEPLDDKRRSIVRDLSHEFGTWTGDTMEGRFVDGKTTVDLTHRIMGFDITELENAGAVGTLGMMLIGEMNWQRAHMYPSVPKLAVFDEAWKLLQNDRAKATFEEFFRRGRHLLLGAVAITQTATDFDDMPGVLLNVSNFFIGSLPGQEKRVAEMLKLTDEARVVYDSLSGAPSMSNLAQAYKEFFAYNRTADGGHGDVVRVYSSPLQKWTYSTNKIHDIRRAQVIEKRGGDILAALRELADAE